MIRIDFHVHTNYSPDSLLSLNKLAKKSASTGVVPGITDHNSISSFSRLKEMNIRFIPGVEINAKEGHVIALYPTELIPRGLSFSETLDRIKEQGALAYLPHMYDSMRNGIIPAKDDTSKIDIVEVFNSRCLFSSLNSKAEKFAEKHDILRAGGSDAHSAWEFGKAYTELPAFDMSSPKELLKSLKAAKVFGKQTPFYVRYSISATTKVRKLLGLWNAGRND